MNKVTVIVTLVIVTIVIFGVATFIFSPDKKLRSINNDPINSENLKLDCTGVWEENPLCIERNNAIKALQEYEILSLNIEETIDFENKNIFDKSKILKNEGDKFFKGEFYFKSEEKYLEAVGLVNEISLNFDTKIENLKTKAVLAFENDELQESLQLFKELKDLYQETVFDEYINKINNREQILNENENAKHLLENKDFVNAKISIFKSLSLDKDYAPSIDLKNKILDQEKKYNFKNYISRSYSSIKELNFNDAHNNLIYAENIFSNSPEVSQLKGILIMKEREHKIQTLQSSIKSSITNEQWFEALNNIESLKKINTSVVNLATENYITNVLNFYKLAEKHLNNPDRLSSENVLEEAKINYEKGINLNNSSTPELNESLNQLNELINNYSKRIVITFISNNQTYLDIERFQSFDPFEKFSINVRPGKYVFIAKRQGVVAHRIELVIDPFSQDLTFMVMCELDCKIF